VKKKFSHVDAKGKIKMVDVSDKGSTKRSATASCTVLTTIDLAARTSAPDELHVITSARLAGILAAKSTAQLIPLCHPLNLDDVQVEIVAVAQGAEIRSSVATMRSTGVEMEALTACSIAALNLLTSLVADDPFARMNDLVVLQKSGGKSGDWGRHVEP